MPPAKIIHETERLFLTEFDEADTAFILELVNSEGWLKYIGDRQVRTPEAALAYINNGPRRSYEKHGFGLYAVRLKDSGRPIGMCGLIKRDTLDAPDIGFAFLPAFAGKGYGYEAAACTLKHAREVLTLERILAVTLPANERSILLLEKLGLQSEVTISFPGSNDELLLYATLPPKA
jgi:RimJ/RimL family protein N-acetyltransferase